MTTDKASLSEDRAAQHGGAETEAPIAAMEAAREVLAALPPGQDNGDAGAAVETDAGNAAPAYPPLARQRGLEGQVVVEVHVNAEGRAERVTVKESSGWRVLNSAAAEAVQRWRFRAARRGGQLAADRLEVPVVFRLTASGTAR